ncbi:MAG TPA: DUF2127 domain-containing protein [Nitrososphaeraceae archaeon]|jgi:hypothetical protein|nr:DUF2127 domain-containing protein [Nitrososphaeraceae archaeon]
MNIKRPIGITIISILIFLNGSFLLFSGIVAFFLASNFVGSLDSLDLLASNFAETNNTNFSNINSNAIKNFNYFLYFIAVSITLFSLIHFVISYGLLKGKSWARTTTLIISFMSLVGNILMILTVLSLFTVVESILNSPSILFGNILTIIINTLIIYYLLRKEVKDYFYFRSSNKSFFSSSFDELR